MAADQCFGHAAYLTGSPCTEPRSDDPGRRPQYRSAGLSVRGAATAVANVARPGMVQLERHGWLDNFDLLWLRASGIDVDDFRVDFSAPSEGLHPSAAVRPAATGSPAPGWLA